MHSKIRNTGNFNEEDKGMEEEKGVEYKFTLRDGEERYEIVHDQSEVLLLMRKYNAIKAERVNPPADVIWSR